VSVRSLLPLAEYVRARLSALGERFDETSGHTADPAVRAGIAGSTADLGAEIVADDDADNTTTAGEAGGTATPVNAGRSRRRRFDRGHHDEHAAQFGKPGDDSASRQAGLYLRAPIDCRPSPSASGEHRAAVSAGRSCSLFGWPKERIEVIDDDLGKSGTSSDSRGGFQRLIAEIGLGKAGLVLSLDASRLARNNHDWHQLLELCSLFGVLIADGERVYDPCAYHDRLLLGLSGIMSEAELHQIKLRLHQGERQKAARGELRVPLPAGLAYGRDGRIGFNPDEEVHARLLHLFAKFRELRSAKAVMRHFQGANFLVPVRPLDGPSPHDVVWRPASNARILQVLKNPAYAGAYVYGRRRRTPIGRRSGSPQGATEAVAIQDWPVCLKDAFSGYIDWEEFMANQRRLADNLNHYEANRHGVPRQGNALLQGIAICGRCGRRMGLHYSGQNGNYPVYLCRADQHQHGGPRCQEVWASMRRSKDCYSKR